MSSKNVISHKIGLYIRVSTEEQAKNPEGSIKSQEQRLRQYVEFKNLEGKFGEITSVFIDSAKSGKDTNRPQLQRLLKAIRENEITLVMVSELSRLSRSIKDFSEIWEMMKAHNCQFLCLREQFDTTTAAGEMVLFTIANISQFERKQVSERVSANFAARAKRGLHNGGSIAAGYRPDPDKKGYLLVDEEDAEVVKKAFQIYLECGALAKAATVLNSYGYRLARRRPGHGGVVRLGHFTVDNLQALLTNKGYLGLRIYKEQDEEKTATACWPAIIERDTFDRVQALLKRNKELRVKLSSPSRYPFLLSTLTVCGKCGDRLTGKSAHGNSGKVTYYEHGWATKRQSSLNKKIFHCSPQRYQTKTIEPLVWNEIETLICDQSMAETLISKAKTIHQSQSEVVETNRLRGKIRGTGEQIEALAEHLSKIPRGVSPTPIYNQMEKLQAIKDSLQKEFDLQMRSMDYQEEPAALKDYQKFLKFLSSNLGQRIEPADKAKIARALLAKVEIFPSSVKIYYKVGQVVLNAALIRTTTEKGHLKSSEVSQNKKARDNAGSARASNFFWSTGSNSLTNGGGTQIRTVDP